MCTGSSPRAGSLPHERARDSHVRRTTSRGIGQNAHDRDRSFTSRTTQRGLRSAARKSVAVNVRVLTFRRQRRHDLPRAASYPSGAGAVVRPEGQPLTGRTRPHPVIAGERRIRLPVWGCRVGRMNRGLFVVNTASASISATQSATAARSPSSTAPPPERSAQAPKRHGPPPASPSGSSCQPPTPSPAPPATAPSSPTNSSSRPARSKPASGIAVT
jgi:hypothetical protein